MLKLDSKAACLAELDRRKVPYLLHEHPAVFTMAEMAEHLKLTKSSLIKNLFYYDKKNNFYLVLAKTQTKVEKAFWKEVGTTGGNVRLAKDEHLTQVLSVKKGSVTPLALCNDEKKVVKYLVVDKKLQAQQFWAFHPIENTATVEVGQKDVLAWVEELGVKVAVLDLERTEAKEDEKKEEVKKKEDKKEGKEEGKKKEEDEHQTKLKLQFKKQQNFSKWYQQIIVKSEMIQYYDVSGCYILRPWAYEIWQVIQETFDRKIKGIGVQNAYFPMFVSKAALQTEKDHIQGFAPEVAWVTRSGNKEMKEPIAIRPTSETIMYPSYAKWIKSHRDLPLLLNQWASIVRWEFKHPTPFIRTREFLWQQGHTAHATKAETDAFVYTILQFYRQIYQDLLAVPVVKGTKTESQKFAGAFYTTSIETWINENGRGIQAATSHQLGQNFAKMFQIQFLNEKNEKSLVWQTSWGLTTRTIGIMVMFHGDNIGLVLPPRVAVIQVVIVPIPYKGKEAVLLQKAKEIKERLLQKGLKVHLDERMNYTPGWKFSYWQLKGVPIRIELGPKDLEKGEVRLVRRYDGFKWQAKEAQLQEMIPAELGKIHEAMLERARAKLNEKFSEASTFDQFMSRLNEGKTVKTPWCMERECEEKVKQRSGKESKEVAKEEQSLTGAAKTLCVPLEGAEVGPGQVCFHCGSAAKTKVIWGRSY